MHSFRALPFNFVCFVCFVFLLRFIMFFPHFFPRNGFLFSGIFAALPITSRALLVFCLQSPFASQTMGLCKAFLATSSLSFLLFGLVVFKGILFCQLCRIFSHCLVLFPGHPFFIFACFSMCVSCLPNLFSSSFSFARFTFCFIPVWSI